MTSEELKDHFKNFIAAQDDTHKEEEWDTTRGFCDYYAGKFFDWLMENGVSDE